MRVIFVCTIGFLLAACGSVEVSPTVTPLPSPTLTNTPTLTPTLTLTPTPTMTLTPTLTPTPDLEEVTLSLEDLPERYETIQTGQGAVGGEGVDVIHYRAFRNQDLGSVVTTFTGVIMPDMLDQVDVLIDVGLYASLVVANFEPTPDAIFLEGRFGENSAARRDFYSDPTGWYALETVVFREGTTLVFVSNTFRRGTEPGVDVIDLATILEERVEAAHR